MQVTVFFIDWGFPLDIVNVVKDIRLLPDDSQAKKVPGLAKNVEVNGKCSELMYSVIFNYRQYWTISWTKSLVCIMVTQFPRYAIVLLNIKYFIESL